MNMTRQAADQCSGKARVLWNLELLEELLRQLACVPTVLGQCVIARDCDPIRRQNEYRCYVLLHVLRSLLLDVVGEGLLFARESRSIVFLSMERLRFELRCQSANLAPIPPNRGRSCVVRLRRIHQRLNESFPFTLGQSQSLVFLDDFVGRVGDGGSHQVRDRDAAQAGRCFDDALFFLRDARIQSFRPLSCACFSRHCSHHLGFIVYGTLPHITRFLYGKSTHSTTPAICRAISEITPVERTD